MLVILSRLKFKCGLNFFLFAVLVLFLAGCETPKSLNPFAEKQIVPACPVVRLLKDMDLVTVYQPGLGRDITDILYEGEITGFKGECDYIGKDGVYSHVKVVLKVDFKIIRGPAGKTEFLTVPYFVAIPEFYPSPSGRSDFPFRVRFPKNENLMSVSDQEVEVSIPLTASRKGPKSRVYIGFQLTADQLQFNRQKRQVLSVN